MRYASPGSAVAARAAGVAVEKGKSDEEQRNIGPVVCQRVVGPVCVGG